jgi:hypothetical protein
MQPVLRRGGPQLAAVRAALAGGDWLSLRELAAASGAPQQSVSSRLRDLRKRMFGSHLVERRRRWGRRQWEYRIPLEGIV